MISFNPYFFYQGPKEETLEDFWRMVWEHSIPTIVMLTRVFEGKVNRDYVECLAVYFMI